MRWVKRGAAGMAVLAATRLLWQLSRPVEWSADTAASLERDRDTDERAPDA
jgi:hypothetical protein